MFSQFRYLGIVVCLCVSLSGCSTTSVTPSEAISVPSFENKQLTSRLIPVVITRDRGWLASRCDAVIRVDNVPVAVLLPGETVTLQLPQQSNKVEAKVGFCADQLDVVPSSSQRTNIRLKITPFIGPQLIDQSTTAYKS